MEDAKVPRLRSRDLATTLLIPALFRQVATPFTTDGDIPITFSLGSFVTGPQVVLSVHIFSIPEVASLHLLVRASA